MIRSFNFYTIFGFCSLLLLFGCHTQKSLVTKEHIPMLSLDSMISIIQKNQIFNDFTAKGRLNYSDAENHQEVQLTLQCQSDRGIVIGVRKLGFEIARILLKKDSVTWIDRFNQTWSSQALQTWLDKYHLPVDYYFIQDLLISGIYLSDYLHYNLVVNPNDYLLHGTSELFSINNELERKTYIPRKTKMILEDRNVNINIIQTLLLEQKNIPSHLSFDVTDPKSGDIKIDIQWKELSLKPIEKLKFEIPSHYSEVVYE